MRFGYVAALCSGLWLAVAPPVATAQQSMAEGVGKMRLQTPGKPHNYARVVFPDGTRAERFLLRTGECVRSIGDCRDDRERVEFAAERTGIRPGDTVWYAWSVFVPREFPQLTAGSPNYTIGQIHQRDDSGPELLFSLFHDGLFAELSDPTRLDSDPMNPVGGKITKRLARQSDLRGRWTRIRLRATWSRGADGAVELWMNDRKVWTYTGPTTNSNGELYFKYGLYRSFVSRCKGPCPEASVYYANVRQGRSEGEVE